MKSYLLFAWSETALFALLMCGSPASQRPEPGQGAIAQSPGLHSIGGQLWGNGPGYKVAFEDDGIRFVPALGRHTNGDASLRFRLESVGRESVVPTLAAKPTMSVDGTTVHYTRPDFVESYEVRCDGVEQSFTFTKLPPGSGDLIVRGRIDTSLTSTADGIGDLDRLGFEVADHGGVSFDGVFGIDARGARVSGSMRLEDGVIELVLPAEFADGAALPLVLDPLIGPVINVSNNANDYRCDVAYDATNDVYLVIWSRLVSPGSELLGQRVAPNGSLIGPMIVIEAGGTNEYRSNARVANVNKTDRFLVAWENNFSIHCRAVDAASGGVSARATIAAYVPAGVVTHYWVDVGGEASLNGQTAIVVWLEGIGQQTRSVKACRVEVAATGVPVPFGHRTIHGGAWDSWPAISQSGGAAGRHLIAWARAPGWRTPFDQILGTIVDRNLQVLASNWIFPSDGIHLAVDGDGSNWVVAWERDDDIFASTVTYDPSLGSTVVGSEVGINTKPIPHAADPAVAYIGPVCLVGYDERALPFGIDHKIHVHSLDAATLDPCEGALTASTGNLYNSYARLASQRSGDPSAGDDVLLAWQEDDANWDGQIRARLFSAMGAGGPVSNVGGGCGAGGAASANGPFAIGNPEFSFGLTGAAPTATAAFFNVNTAVSPLGCGACTITPPFIVVPRPIAGGAATMPFPLPCNMSIIGATLEVQWWVAGTSVSPCVLAPSFSISDRLQASVGL